MGYYDGNDPIDQFDSLNLDISPSSISLDDLFKRENYAQQCRQQTYNKILARVQKRIKDTSRQRNPPKYCFYNIPEVIVGAPLYKIEDCVEYLLTSLSKNGFKVSYVHPNLMVVSWEHWINPIQRQKIYEEYGVRVDGFGNIISNKKSSITSLTSSLSDKKKSKPPQRDISSYKPMGLYGEELIKSIAMKDK